eukprot:Em0014g656a
MKSSLSVANATNSCLDRDAVNTFRATNGVFAALGCVPCIVSIVAILAAKKYKQCFKRLILYLSIVSLLSSIIGGLEAIDLTRSSQGTQRNACQAFGFLANYLAYCRSCLTCVICLDAFAFSRYHRQLQNWRFEALVVFLATIMVPTMLSWEYFYMPYEAWKVGVGAPVLRRPWDLVSASMMLLYSALLCFDYTADLVVKATVNDPNTNQYAYTAGITVVMVFYHSSNVLVPLMLCHDQRELLSTDWPARGGGNVDRRTRGISNNWRHDSVNSASSALDSASVARSYVYVEEKPSHEGINSTHERSLLCKNSDKMPSLLVEYMVAGVDRQNDNEMANEPVEHVMSNELVVCNEQVEDELATEEVEDMMASEGEEDRMASEGVEDMMASDSHKLEDEVTSEEVKDGMGEIQVEDTSPMLKVWDLILMQLMMRMTVMLKLKMTLIATVTLMVISMLMFPKIF